MAIQVHMGDYHRCTDCGKKWFVKLPQSKWFTPPDPHSHPCPKCSAPKPEPPKVKCGWPAWHLGLGLVGACYCPGCGVALPAKQEGA